MKGWTKKLTKTELKHLRQDAGCRSFEHVKKAIEGQKDLEFPCWDCIAIGRKLGLWKD